MSEATSDAAKVIEAIKANSREFFPNDECAVRHDHAGNCWVLVVNHDDLRSRFTAKTLAGLLKPATRVARIYF